MSPPWSEYLVYCVISVALFSFIYLTGRFNEIQKNTHLSLWLTKEKDDRFYFTWEFRNDLYLLLWPQTSRNRTVLFLFYNFFLCAMCYTFYLDCHAKIGRILSFRLLFLILERNGPKWIKTIFISKKKIHWKLIWIQFGCVFKWKIWHTYEIDCNILPSFGCQRKMILFIK